MIRNLNKSDFNRWCNLYKSYANFYKVPMNKEILDNFGDGFMIKTILLMVFAVN